MSLTDCWFLLFLPSISCVHATDATSWRVVSRGSDGSFLFLLQRDLNRSGLWIVNSAWEDEKLCVFLLADEELSNILLNDVLSELMILEVCEVFHVISFFLHAF